MSVPLTPSVDKNWSLFGGIHGTIVNSYLASVSVNNTLSLSGVYQISPDIHCHLPDKSQSSTAGNYDAPTSVPLSLGNALYFAVASYTILRHCLHDTLHSAHLTL
jgi:hypothetical protein